MSDAGRVILIVLGVVLLVAAVLPLMMLGMMSAMMGGMMGGGMGGMMGGPWPMVVFTLLALVAGVALLVIGLRRPGASTGG